MLLIFSDGTMPHTIMSMIRSATRKWRRKKKRCAGALRFIRWNHPAASRATSLKLAEETTAPSRAVSKICARREIGIKPMPANVCVPIVEAGIVWEAACVSASIPLLLAAEDKLDALRYLDEFHYWHSLDDERVCQRCRRTITGRQIVVIELQGTRGKLRLQCPTAGCAATVSEWVYANPVQAARQRADLTVAKNGEAKPADGLNLRTHHGNRAAVHRRRRKPLFAAASSLREVAARLHLLRPLATALHAFRPVA
jgi:hypothetical protein